MDFISIDFTGQYGVSTLYSTAELLIKGLTCGLRVLHIISSALLYCVHAYPVGTGWNQHEAVSDKTSIGITCPLLLCHKRQFAPLEIIFF